ncbi:helix-turn-helix transcriptional regulator [Streptantibioticus ferralitis]|uniref:LuxR family transcriptional regulator n=1 Tax=Streptantibioticus ferralitis TaxID=236510 RepID=A0ABT5Z4P0_9ACTN|nr:LuxR family transcriptional regulator [Streptantibioticus ferralitis]MDF2258790.1 LuxR family transcriptional regulator [Streptantibioticus ferralitis]
MERRAPLIGRDSQVSTVAEVLRSSGVTQTLLVTGDAGAGKTAVVEQGRRTAVGGGARVLRLAWEGVSGPAGAAALVDAVCGVLSKIHDGRLPVRITAIRRVQLRTTDGGSGSELALLSMASEMLADAASYIPFAVFADDVDRMPPQTAAALRLMLRTFRPAGIPVVMAGRAPAGPGGQERAVADRVLDLPPLQPDEVGRLVEQRIGRAVEPALVQAVLGALGPLAGNPAAVLSVLTTLDENGGLLELGGRTGLVEPEGRLLRAPDVAELCRLGWPDAAPDARRLEIAGTLARLVHHAELRLEDLCGVTVPGGDVGRTLDQLVRDRVLSVDRDGRVSFTVPALAAALRRLPAGRDVRSVHAGVVRSVTDRLGPATTGACHPRLADHVVAAGAMLDDALAVPLLLAAARQDARVDQPRAARAYSSALRRLPPGDREMSEALREAAASGLRHAGHGGVLALGEPLLACIEAPERADRAGLELVTRMWTLAALHEHRSPYEPGAAPEFHAVLERMPQAAALAALGGRYGIGPVVPWPAGADGAAETGGVCGRGLLPSPAQVRLLAAAVGGRVALERAVRNLPRNAVGEAAVEQLRSAAAYGDLAGALAAVLGQQSVPDGHSTAIRYHAVVRDYLAGEWDSALAGARRIEALGRADGGSGVGQLARALAAEIHSFRGELARAREWLELIPDTVAHPLVARVRLGVRFWSGQSDKALEAAWDDVSQARRSGLLVGVDRLLLRILTFAVESEQAQTAHQALEKLEELHEEVGTAMTREAVLLGRGVLHRDADAMHAAYRSVERRGDRHLTLYCCQVLTDVADDPMPWLTEAAHTVHELAIGRPVRVLFGQLAQRLNLPLPRHRSFEEGLSDRDVQLIGMVSDGATNRQIAARLACSEKTVEQRLARLYQRTGRRSRVELAAAWLDGSLTWLGPVPDALPAGTSGPAARSGPVGA